MSKNQYIGQHIVNDYPDDFTFKKEIYKKQFKNAGKEFKVELCYRKTDDPMLGDVLFEFSFKYFSKRAKAPMKEYSIYLNALPCMMLFRPLEECFKPAEKVQIYPEWSDLMMDMSPTPKEESQEDLEEIAHWLADPSNFPGSDPCELLETIDMMEDWSMAGADPDLTGLLNDPIFQENFTVDGTDEERLNIYRDYLNRNAEYKYREGTIDQLIDPKSIRGTKWYYPNMEQMYLNEKPIADDPVPFDEDEKDYFLTRETTQQTKDLLQKSGDSCVLIDLEHVDNPPHYSEYTNVPKERRVVWFRVVYVKNKDGKESRSPFRIQFYVGKKYFFLAPRSIIFGWDRLYPNFLQENFPAQDKCELTAEEPTLAFEIRLKNDKMTDLVEKMRLNLQDWAKDEVTIPKNKPAKN